MLDLDVLGFIDHNITVNIIRDGEIVAKKPLTLPKNHQCDPLQESPLHHIYRAGTGSSLLPSRRGKRDLPLPVLRGEIPVIPVKIKSYKKQPVSGVPKPLPRPAFLSSYTLETTASDELSKGIDRHAVVGDASK